MSVFLFLKHKFLILVYICRCPQFSGPKKIEEKEYERICFTDCHCSLHHCV